MTTSSFLTSSYQIYSTTQGPERLNCWSQDTQHFGWAPIPRLSLWWGITEEKVTLPNPSMTSSASPRADREEQQQFPQGGLWVRGERGGRAEWAEDGRVSSCLGSQMNGPWFGKAQTPGRDPKVGSQASFPSHHRPMWGLMSTHRPCGEPGVQRAWCSCCWAVTS